MAVHATVTESSLEVRFTGWDRIWSLSSGVTIPRDQIIEARATNRVSALARLRWRVGGTHVPGLFHAGHFTLRSRAGRALVNVRRSPVVLQVTTRLWRPHLLLVQHPDAETLAAQLGAHGDSTTSLR